MFCSNCGKDINYKGNFCESCGSKFSEPFDLATPPQQTTSYTHTSRKLQPQNDSTAVLESNELFVVDLDAEYKLEFYKKVYIHLATYICIFALLSKLLFDLGFGYAFLEILGESRFFWLAIIGGFWISSRISDHFSRKLIPNLSYLGPSIAIVAEAIIFAPLFAYADYSHEGVIENAVFASILIISSLIIAVHVLKTNFEPLGLFLKIGSVIAIGFIIASVIFDFNLGLAFSWVMLALATGYILYDTSQIIKVYRPDEYILASTRLLGSALFFFYYALRIFSLNDD
jgi:FtsH-binding integral membrane protein